MPPRGRSPEEKSSREVIFTFAGLLAGSGIEEVPAVLAAPEGCWDREETLEEEDGRGSSFSIRDVEPSGFRR